MKEPEMVPTEPWLPKLPGTGCFLDIGCHSGEWTNTYLPQFQQVIAFDCQIEPLCDLLHMSPVDYRHRLIIYPIGLSSAAHTLIMNVCYDTAQSSFDQPSPTAQIEERRPLLVYPLDELSLPISYPIHDIKIDTEGHEIEVVRGAVKTLRRHRPRLLVEIHNRANGEALQTLLYCEHYHIKDVIRHPRYIPDSPEFYTHYWIWFWPEEII